jgi:hypothetical protein
MGTGTGGQLDQKLDVRPRDICTCEKTHEINGINKQPSTISVHFELNK